MIKTDQESIVDINERVARGAAWLDEKQPGWRHLVNVGPLNLFSGLQCVLGQVFGSYFTTLDNLFPDHGAWSVEGSKWSQDHGFNAASLEDRRHLEQLWKAEVHKREGQAA